MIGLDYLINKLDKYTIDTLPHSIILVGKNGSGKHSICKYISDKFNLNILDISDDLSDDLIDNIYRNASNRLYMVDLRKITEKEQNILLKLFEEPASNTFLILITNNIMNILPTVLNRGKLVTIRDYSDDELNEFAKEHNIKIDNRYLNTIIETPGDLLSITNLNIDLSAIETLTDKIITKMNKASFANTLSIIDKLNFKDEYDKIDVNFFLKMLKYKYLEAYIQHKTTFELCNLINTELTKLIDTRLNKKIFVTELLIKIWKEVRK